MPADFAYNVKSLMNTLKQSLGFPVVYEAHNWLTFANPSKVCEGFSNQYVTEQPFGQVPFFTL